MPPAQQKTATKASAPRPPRVRPSPANRADRLRDYYRADAAHPAVRGAHRRDVPAGQDRRLLPPQPRRRGHRRRPDGRDGAARLPLHDLPRARLRDRARHRAAPRDGRAVRPHHRGFARAGAARCTCTTSRSGCSAATRIVGGQIPPATGAALAIAYRGPGGPDAEAVVCQLGDATTNIGAWHESLNLAAIWKLPIVFLIVNNHLGMGTSVERASGEPDLYKRGVGVSDPRRTRRRQ